MTETNHTVEKCPIASLKPYPRNARTHSKRQIRQIADSIKAFGFTNPVLIDAEGGIIAGHGRVEAAKLLELETVPTLRIDHLSEAEKRAYIIADNKLAELAGWDPETLALELQSLLDIEVDLDVTVTGFEAPEIDLLIQGLAEDDDPDDEQPTIDEAAAPVSRSGDLWCLGDHRLLCADARESHSYARLMGQDKARMVLTDPPYNVPITGNVCGLGSVKHSDFAMASGEMTPADFTAFLETALGHMATHSLDGSLHYIFMDWRHLGELLAAGNAVYRELKNLCVWAKTNAGMGSLYRSQHELVFVFKKGSTQHVNNVELGRFGRHRSNIWTYAGVNTFRHGRMDELAMHPTVKPVALLSDAIQDASNRGDIVLDPFVGSGSTIIAAERVGRRAWAMELEPRYIDVAVNRWQKSTGGTAVHADTGLGFEQMAATRVGGTPPREPAKPQEAVNG